MIDNAVLAAFNHLLSQAGWARQRLAPFVGRHVQVSMPPWRFSFQVLEGGWAGAAAADASPDVDIACPAAMPFLAAQGLDHAMQAVRIEGNAQFATELSDVLKNLRWDYEEDLSRLFGDIAAHRIAGGIAAFTDWQKRAAGRFAQDFVFHATEKSRMLAHRNDQQSLSEGITELLAMLARAERRVHALAARSARTP